MTPLFLILFLAATIISTSCSDNTGNYAKDTTKIKDSTAQTATDNSISKNSEAIDDIVSGYLKLKNALANDDGKEAANAANEISTALAKAKETELTPDQKKIYAGVKEDIKENAAHIGANGSNIAHQREHFDLLSKELIDLVQVIGTSQALYLDFCPMYSNKGASWLSETKEIKNPYFGKEMFTCGEVKQEIKAKE